MMSIGRRTGSTSDAGLPMLPAASYRNQVGAGVDPHFIGRPVPGMERRLQIRVASPGLGDV